MNIHKIKSATTRPRVLITTLPLLLLSAIISGVLYFRGTEINTSEIPTPDKDNLANTYTTESPSNPDDRTGIEQAGDSDLSSTSTNGETPTSEPTAQSPNQSETSAAPNEPVAITVVSFRQIVNGENIVCELTYSDGDTFSWPHKTVTYSQGVRVVSKSGKCDSSVIGRVINQ